MILKCVSNPVIEPITLTDVEGQCRITDLSSESITVDLFISAIRQRAESITRRAFVTQTWDLLLDSFPAGWDLLNIPLPPLQSVESVTYTDSDGVSQIWDASEYRVITESEPAFIVPAYGYDWPTVLDDILPIRIRFIAGYGDNAGDVPAAIRQWMLVNIANLYENRESIQVANWANIVELKTLADGLLDNYRIYGW